MQKLILKAAVLGAVLAMPASAALASSYAQPGYPIASGNTPCADHGSFGYFGANGTVHDLGVNYPGSNGIAGASNWQHPAASGATTGGNNSSLCGNGAAPAPFTTP